MHEHTGTEPDLTEQSDRFKVCFWKPPRQVNQRNFDT